MARGEVGFNFFILLYLVLNVVIKDRMQRSPSAICVMNVNNLSFLLWFFFLNIQRYCRKKFVLKSFGGMSIDYRKYHNHFNCNFSFTLNTFDHKFSCVCAIVVACPLTTVAAATYNIVAYQETSIPDTLRPRFLKLSTWRVGPTFSSSR